MTEQKRVPVLMDPAQYEQLRKLAYDTRESMSEHIRKALTAYLAQIKK